MKIKVNLKTLSIVIGTLIYFAVFIIFIEAMLHKNFGETITWAGNMKYAYLFNVLIVFCLFLFFLGLINNYFVSFVLMNGIILFLVTISYYKFSFLGEFLYPWDLFLVGNVVQLLPNLYQEVYLKKLLTLIITIVLVIGAISYYFITKKRKRDITLNWWQRVVAVSVSLLMMSAFVFYRSAPPVKYVFDDVVKVFNQPWNQNNNYKVNGFLVSFLFNMQSALVLPPNGYNEKNIAKIVGELKSKERVKTISTKKNPNIIIIMNEAFWDPTLLDNISITPDPIPTIREHKSGWALSPTFGGGTSNVEFEVLTGLSNEFMPIGSVPYQQYIKNKMPAIPNYLKGFGYKTLALHPYPKWFWNREEVYNHFGFDEFIDIAGFNEPIYKGPYVSDHQVSKTIIEQTENTDEPLFIYAITMQNHTSYHADRYEEYTVETSGDITDAINGTLRTYAQGVSDADEAFAELIDYFEESDEPTILVFFGDHLPTLGLEYDLYRQTGYLPPGKGEENWQLEEHRKMKSTPLVFWNNFNAPIPAFDTISTSFIGPLALEMAGLEQPLFFSFLEEYKEHMPGFTREVKIDEDDNLFSATPEEIQELKKIYQLIQYDFIFGNQFAEKSLFPIKISAKVKKRVTTEK